MARRESDCTFSERVKFLIKSISLTLQTNLLPHLASTLNHSGILFYFTLASIACPAGWEFYGSSCYKFSDMKKNWLDAKTDCRTSGGYLLKIDDATEQHFITYRLISGNKVSGRLAIYS